MGITSESECLDSDSESKGTLGSEYTYTSGYESKTDTEIETVPEVDICQDEMDELGQLMYLQLSLYGHYKTLPCYTDAEGRYFIKGKLTMHKSPTHATIEVKSCNTHLGFYADSSEAVYMHHKECNPEHLTKQQESPLPPKVLRYYGHIDNTEHFYVDDAGCKYNRIPSAKSGRVLSQVDATLWGDQQEGKYWGSDHAHYYHIKDLDLQKVTLVDFASHALSKVHQIKQMAPNSICTLNVIDFAIVFCLPTHNDEQNKWFTTALGITFERFLPNPPKNVSKRPLLRMLEEPESKIIVYQDVQQNFYRPIPPHDMTEDEAMDWHPSLSRIDSRTDKVQLESSNPRLSKSSSPRLQEQVASLAPQHVNHLGNETKVSSVQDPSFNLIAENQTPIGDFPFVRTLLANLSSVPQPIESSSSPTLLAKDQKPIEASANTSMLLEQLNSKALPTERTLLGKRSEPQGQSQVIPAVGKLLHKLKLIRSYLPGHFKYVNEQGHTFDVIKMIDKHIDPPIEPLVACETEPTSGLQTYTDELGNVYKPTFLLLSQGNDQPRQGKMAPSLLTLHSNDENKDRDLESDIHTIPQSTRELSKEAQNVSKFTHMNTSREQGILTNTCIPLQTLGSEQFMAKSFKPLWSNMQNHGLPHKNMLSEPESIKVSNPFAETNISIMGSETNNAHKVLPLPPWQDTIEPRQGGNPPKTCSIEVPPCPKAVPTAQIFSQAEKKILNLPAIPKTSVIAEPQSKEHMLVDKYLLTLKASNDEHLCLYENGKGTLFQLLSLRSGKAVCQSEMPRYPTVGKYIHVTHLTYTFRDKEGNKYQPYHGKLEERTVFDAKSFESKHTHERTEQSLVGMSTVQERAIPLLRACVGCAIDHLFKDCPLRVNPMQAPPQVVSKDKVHGTPTPKVNPKAISPPKSPPKRQILPQTTTDLIRSQVLCDQERNAKQESAKKDKGNTLLEIETTRDSNVSSSVKSNKEAPKSTVVSIGKRAQPCVIEKPGTVGSTYNHEEHIKSANDGSPLWREPAKQSPTLETNPQQNPSASSQAGVELKMTNEQAQIPQPHDKADDAESVKTLRSPTRIAINIQSENGPQLKSIALLDRCVQYQLMSYQTWTLLGKPLLYFVPSTAKTIIDSIGTCIGVLDITLSIGSHSETGRFFVMAPGQLQEEVILGKKWMAQRQCYRGLSKLLLSIPGDNELSMSVPLVLGDQGIHFTASIPPKSQVHNRMGTSRPYLNKGKAKEELSMASTSKLSHASTPTKANGYLTTQLTEGQKGSATTSHQQRKLYQPKYPSLRAQHRRIRQVLVPKQLVQTRGLSDGDEQCWVERQATTSLKSSGWLSPYKSLEAQGYFQGNRKLWLPKPEFQAYKVPSKDGAFTRKPQGQRNTSQRSKQTQVKQKQSQQNKNPLLARKVTTGIPKATLAQLPVNESNNFVRIQERSYESKAYKERVVPQALLSKQGYYEGNTKLWLPRPLLKTPSRSGISNGYQQLVTKTTKQWRPIEAATANNIPSCEAITPLSLPSRQSWVQKSTKDTPTHQAIAVKQELKWVLKLIARDEKCSLVVDQASTSSIIIAKDTTSVINSGVTNLASTPMRLPNSTSCSKFNHLNIKERALLLQFQLFGMTSIRHSFFSKDDFYKSSQVAVC